MKQIAIIAPTASGKTALSIELAHKTNSIILSLDSLSVYKQINIASAKPTLQEQDGIIHFGIDEIYPNEKFDVMKFIDIYHKTKDYAILHNKNIIIVGGTTFYLKMMIDGISYVPPLTKGNQKILQQKLATFTSDQLYNYLYQIDPIYMQNIQPNDIYRIEKTLSIYLSTNTQPTIYFKQHPPVPVIDNLKLFSIDINKSVLDKRIKQRTELMIQDGIIDETIFLEQTYTRAIDPMNSIGLKETLEYLDGKLTKTQLQEKITLSTIKLAKRQRTFNKGQFKNVILEERETLKKEILKFFSY